MSTESKVRELRESLKQLFSDEGTTYFASARTFPDMPDAPGYSELKSTYERLFSLYKPLIADPQPLLRLPFSSVNNLASTAQGAANAFVNARTNADSSAFKGFAQQLDGLGFQTHMSGLEFLMSGGASIEAARLSLSADQKTLQNDLAVLQKHNLEAETLQKQIRSLIAPAVAGSLSKAFSDRSSSLKNFRNVWLGISGGIGTIAAVGFYKLGTFLAATLAEKTGAEHIWSVVGLRFLFLVPVLVLLGFALTQYRKERNLEEEYAHKAAVAVSLPNYGDLLPPGTVREQIVSAAANVIFSSPVGRSEQGDSESVVSGTKELIEAISKLTPPWWKGK